jgi:hypothetical protein
MTVERWTRLRCHHVTTTPSIGRAGAAFRHPPLFGCFIINLASRRRPVPPPKQAFVLPPRHGQPKPNTTPAPPFAPIFPALFLRGRQTPKTRHRKQPTPNSRRAPMSRMPPVAPPPPITPDASEVVRAKSVRDGERRGGGWRIPPGDAGCGPAAAAQRRRA